jgi:hypothetical protein
VQKDERIGMHLTDDMRTLPGSDEPKRVPVSRAGQRRREQAVIQAEVRRLARSFRTRLEDTLREHSSSLDVA